MAQVQHLVEHTAPAGVRRLAIVIGDTVHVWIGENLDELARRRYIEEKIRLYGLDQGRRRGLVGLLPIGGGRRPSSTAVAIGGGAVAAGVAAATVLPFTLSGQGAHLNRPHAVPAHSHLQRPPAAAHPPAGPRTPPGHERTPRSPAEAPANGPASDGPAATRSGSPVAVRPRLVKLPKVRLPAAHLPQLPKPPRAPSPPVLPPTPKPPQALLDVSTPPLGVTVRLSPRPWVDVRVGSRQR